jgi:hypothetical protein
MLPLWLGSDHISLFSSSPTVWNLFASDVGGVTQWKLIVIAYVLSCIVTINKKISSDDYQEAKKATTYAIWKISIHIYSFKFVVLLINTST